MTRSGPTSSAPRDAFLNIPFDRKYEALYLAFIAGLCAFGLTPRAAIEIPSSEWRLYRIIALIRSCRYSFHDLSRVELERTPPSTPRFNMPFELGLAVASAEIGRPRHDWFVLEAVPRRLAKSLSDLSGTDPLLHAGDPLRLLARLADVFVHSRRRPAVGQLESVYADLAKAGPRLKRELRTESLFSPQPFRALVVMASRSALREVAPSGR